MKQSKVKGSIVSMMKMLLIYQMIMSFQKRLKEFFGSQGYTAIQKYILNALSEQPIILSDGKRAIVDKRDALHIANKSGKEKTAHISQIKNNRKLFPCSRRAKHKRR